ncbi:H-NS histone family protein [Polaromonas sp.]|uniref:H-NS histone family protein n=1 Tax=Polaromonas sp. TaxID=1869339 RepID=UPI002489795E|nr:H-NS histone family protein [Polaromonas sp.]MDI1273037.1 H-NS histone family protein [Polaromonas sp.]
MNNLIDIQKQIEELQKKASDIKVKEFQKTVEEIRAKMHAYGITIKDLRPNNTGTSKAKQKPKAGDTNEKSRSQAKKQDKTISPKYQGPAGETWSGRGLTPRWLSSLLAQGKTKEEFAIKS